jgi:hypothetical protein
MIPIFGHDSDSSDGGGWGEASESLEPPTNLFPDLNPALVEDVFQRVLEKLQTCSEEIQRRLARANPSAVGIVRRGYGGDSGSSDGPNTIHRSLNSMYQKTGTEDDARGKPPPSGHCRERGLVDPGVEYKNV